MIDIYLEELGNKEDFLENTQPYYLLEKNIKNICRNCEYYLGEECDLDGNEIWDDDTCDKFVKR